MPVLTTLGLTAAAGISGIDAKQRALRASRRAQRERDLSNQKILEEKKREQKSIEEGRNRAARMDAQRAAATAAMAQFATIGQGADATIGPALTSQLPLAGRKTLIGQ